MNRYFVYILASRKNGTLYVGVTGDLSRRIFIHKQDILDGFTKKYLVHDLVYFEEYAEPILAIEREKRLKKWNRQWKVNLIVKNNPGWKDLSDVLNLM